MDGLQEKSSATKKLSTIRARVPLNSDFGFSREETYGVDKQVLEAARKEGDSRARFWNMLVDYVPRSGFTPPPDRPTEILHVACGKAEEADILTGYFGGGTFGSNSTGSTLVGVDIDPKKIDSAIFKNSYPDFSGEGVTYKLKDNMKFVVGDATNLSAIEQVPEQVDVVMIRHEEISSSGQVWREIFSEAANRLRSSGIMILTSFNDVEHTMLETAISELGLTIVVNEANSWSEEVHKGKVGIDKRIMIVTKH